MSNVSFRGPISTKCNRLWLFYGQMSNVGIIPIHIHYNINMYTRTTSPEFSQCVRPWHYFYRNFLPLPWLHQTWGDLVLCGHNRCTGIKREGKKGGKTIIQRMVWFSNKKKLKTFFIRFWEDLQYKHIASSFLKVHFMILTCCCYNMIHYMHKTSLLLNFQIILMLRVDPMVVLLQKIDFHSFVHDLINYYLAHPNFVLNAS